MMLQSPVFNKKSGDLVKQHLLVSGPEGTIQMSKFITIFISSSSFQPGGSFEPTLKCPNGFLLCPGRGWDVKPVDSDGIQSAPSIYIGAYVLSLLHTTFLVALFSKRRAVFYPVEDAGGTQNQWLVTRLIPVLVFYRLI